MPPSNNIWSRISHDLAFNVTPKAIYNIVKLNRYNIQNTLQLENLIENNETRENEGNNEFMLRSHEENLNLNSADNVENESDESTESTEENSSQEEKKGQLTQNIQMYLIPIAKDTWERIAPVPVAYKRTKKSGRVHASRNRSVPPKGIWTTILNEELWKFTKKSCTWIFKYGFSTENIKFKCLAQCKQCKAKMTIISVGNEISENGIILKVKITGYDPNFRHTNQIKRKLSGQERIRVANEMRGKYSSVYRKQLANSLMEYGDSEPGHLYNSHVLRQVKHEIRAQCQVHKEPFLSIWISKYCPPYIGVFHDIGLDTFFIYYWLPTQMQLYKHFAQKEVTCLSIDATGSLARSPCPPQTKTPYRFKKKHVFLYQGMIKNNKGASFPVIQMLSQSHDIYSIERWLKAWLRAGAPTPKIVISDFSAAIIGAVARAFANFQNAQEYLQQCYNILEGASTKIPKTFIRIDVAHLVKNITTWDCFRERDKRVKEFFVRCMCLLINCISFQSAKAIIKDIVTVALSQTEGMCHSLEVPAEASKKRLKEAIATGVTLPEGYFSNESDFLKVTTEIPDETAISGAPSLNVGEKAWIEEIISEVNATFECDLQGDHDNMHYLPTLIPPLKKLCAKIPLWSAVMVNEFQYGDLRASTSNVENYFKELKNYTLHGEPSRLRIDEFVFKHVEILQGEIKLSASQISSHCTEPRTRTNSISGPDNSIPLPVNEKPNTITLPHDEEHNGNKCVACANGHYPEGAHKCFICNKNVHALLGCSEPADEEGYGQKRICFSCTENKKHKKMEVPNVISQPTNKTLSVQPASPLGCKDVPDLYKRDSIADDIFSNLENNDIPEENWRGLNKTSLKIISCVKPKKRCRYSYLYPKSDWLTMDLKSTSLKSSIGILKNGSLKPFIKDQKVNLALENTCAFDSIIHSLTVIYCDKDVFREKVNVKSSQSDLCKLLKHLATKGVDHLAYKMRALILKDRFPKKTIGLSEKGLAEVIECDTTVANIVSLIVFSDFPTAIEERICYSSYCSSNEGSRRNVPLVRINADKTDNIEGAISEELDTTYSICYRPLNTSPDRVPEEMRVTDSRISSSVLCNGKTKSVFTLSDEIIFIETAFSKASSHRSDRFLDVTVETPCFVEIDSFPVNIKVQNISFELKAIITFMPPSSDLFSGHYVAHCRRPSGCWECFDDLMDKIIPSSKIPVFPHLLIYAV